MSDPNVFGWAGGRDLDAAAAWLQDWPDVTRDWIGGIGFSVGGDDARHRRVEPWAACGRLGGCGRPLDRRAPPLRSPRLVLPHRGDS